MESEWDNCHANLSWDFAKLVHSNATHKIFVHSLHRSLEFRRRTWEMLRRMMIEGAGTDARCLLIGIPETTDLPIELHTLGAH